MSFAFAIIAAIILDMDPSPDGTGTGAALFDGAEGVDGVDGAELWGVGTDTLGDDELSPPVLTRTPVFSCGSPARAPPLPRTGARLLWERPLCVSAAALAPDFTRVMSDA